MTEYLAKENVRTLEKGDVIIKTDYEELINYLVVADTNEKGFFYYGPFARGQDSNNKKQFQSYSLSNKGPLLNYFNEKTRLIRRVDSAQSEGLKEVIKKIYNVSIDDLLKNEY